MYLWSKSQGDPFAWLHCKQHMLQVAGKIGGKLHLWPSNSVNPISVKLDPRDSSNVVHITAFLNPSWSSLRDQGLCGHRCAWPKWRNSGGECHDAMVGFLFPSFLIKFTNSANGFLISCLSVYHLNTTEWGIEEWFPQTFFDRIVSF